ncbi:hypothetical protein V2J09_009116 [Rumex salicifolius]
MKLFLKANFYFFFVYRDAEPRVQFFFIQNVKPTHVFNAAIVAGTLTLADVCEEHVMNFATRCIFEYDAAHPKLYWVPSHAKYSQHHDSLGPASSLTFNGLTSHYNEMDASKLKPEFSSRVVIHQQHIPFKSITNQMSKARVMLFLKPFDAYPVRINQAISGITTNYKVLKHVEDRLQVHKEAIAFCKDVLKRKLIDWEPLSDTEIPKSVHNVDLVVRVGGDGTLLQASRFIDDSVPILGLNSDPTQLKEVEKLSNEFDPARSTGYLCAATVENFERVLDDILAKRRAPSELSRMSISINSKLVWSPALNDVLIAHPSPAAVSRFSFRVKKGGEAQTALLDSRSSGLRVSTATGSTAAMLSAGGLVMPVLSRELQYMVRESISATASDSRLLHGFIKDDETMETTWASHEGAVYIDGSNLVFPLRQGDVVHISLNAPFLRVFLPHHAFNCRL